MYDGSTIPTWLQFNPLTFSLYGLAPLQFYVTKPDLTGNFNFVMTCMDAYEGKVNTTFTITIYDNPPYLINGSIPTQYA